MVDAFLVAGLLVALTLVPATSSRAQIWQPSPDQPQHWYWFRTDRGVPTQVEYMDPRLQEVSDAFGRGDFEGTRRLAEALLESTEDANLCAEASAYLIQSHLAEGDFGSARAAAQRLNDQESLTRINRIEADYKAEVGWLQRIVASAKDPAEAALAQFLTARAHERAYRFDLAEESYWKVVERYPSHSWAGDGVWRIAQLRRARGNAQAALRGCLSAAERFPTSFFIAAGATEGIATLSVGQGKVEEVSASLLALSVRFRGTVLSAWARFYLGDIHWRSDEPDEAADVWQDVWEAEPYGAEIPGVLDRLAEARYKAGSRARELGQPELALVHLAFLSQMPGSEWHRQQVVPASLVLDMAECHLALEHWQDALGLESRSHDLRGQAGDIARALYVEGCARWGLGDYDGAARAWQTAVSEYPATEYGSKCEEKMHP